MRDTTNRLWRLQRPDIRALIDKRYGIKIVMLSKKGMVPVTLVSLTVSNLILLTIFFTIISKKELSISCAELSDRTIELNKENNSLFARKMLKISNIQDYPTEQKAGQSENIIFKCKTDVRWNRRSDGSIIFYLEDDEEDDKFSR